MRRTINYTIILLLVLVGCQTTGPDPTPQPPYSPPGTPTGPWHICIDPGHGGPWSGATAPSNGLRECDVNLAVSLRLRDLLEEEGIKVTMTRTTDTALVLDSLSQDLFARATLANESGADLFISVHHNADIVSPSDKDDIEIYYARRDPAASKQLAAHVLHELATTFSTPEHKLLLPGNYSVIRNTTMPAILTETAYLTHADTAQRYENAQTIEREARSIYRGLMSYLELEPPIRLAASAWEDGNGYTNIDLGGGRNSSITGVHVDGTPVPFTQDQQIDPRATLHERLANSPHDITVRVQENNGARADHQVTHVISRKPMSLDANADGHPSKLAPGSHVQVAVRIADTYGFGVPNVTVEIQGHAARTTEKDGTATFDIPILQKRQKLRVAAGRLKTEVILPGGKTVGWHSVSIAGDTGPISFANVRSEARTVLSSETGWAHVPAGALIVTAPGYEPYSGTTTEPHTVAKLHRVEGSNLFGKTILLDPLDGGRWAGAAGPTGLRSSDVAHDVAEKIAQRLRAVGANPVLLRRDDEEIGELTRITRGESARPNLYLGITFGVSAERARLLDDEGHRLEVPESFVAHYPGSNNGERFATHVQQRLDLERITQTVYYPVQQMSCPAVLIQPSQVQDNEDRLREPHYQTEIAKRIVDSLRDYFAPVLTP